MWYSKACVKRQVNLAFGQPGRNGDGLAIGNNRRFLNKEVDSHCKAPDDYIDYH